MENLVERLVVLNEDGIVRSTDLPDYVIHNAAPQHQTTAPVSLPSDGVDLDGFLEKIENGFIQQALERSRGNKTLAAELLNLNRTTFIERLRKKGMLQSTRHASSPSADRQERDGRRHFSDGVEVRATEPERACACE